MKPVQSLLLVLILFFVPWISPQAVAQKGRAAKEITLQDLLTPFQDLSLLPAYTSYYSAQISSYDTTGGNDDGFSGRYSFLRLNPDSTLVLFDEKGPGVIDRMWTPTPSEDSLAFYIDDLSKPALVIRYLDLFSGKVFPFVGPLCGNQLGGYYCYLPIAFQKSCRIVYLGKKTQFHQIGFHRLEKGSAVQPFSMKWSTADKALLHHINELWDLSGPANRFYESQADMKRKEGALHLKPGQTATMFRLEEGGRILSLELLDAKTLAGLSKDVDIRITWDDESTPAVICPAADFFGYAFGKASMKSLLIGTHDGINYSYFPMPFDKRANIEFISRATEGEEIVIPYRVAYTLKKRNAESEGKFYAYWNHDSPVKTHAPHVLLNVEGRGHYVGTALQAQGLKAGMTYFFEGDDSTAVDGKMRMHGTGSEDFFNGGWYALADRWDAAMSLPLSGALDYSLPLCRTGGYRLFLSDKIPFNKSFYQAIEHGPEGNKAPADYTSVSYYYADKPGLKTAVPPVQNTQVFLPDTLFLYPQLMKLTFEGKVGIEPKWEYPTGGETFYCQVGNNSGMRIDLDEIPRGDYRLYLDYVKAPDECAFSLWQRQTLLADWQSGTATGKERVEQLYLSDVHTDDLVHSVTFRFRTEEDKDHFILNRLMLIRIK